jgi:hypothetical protein
VSLSSLSLPRRAPGPLLVFTLLSSVFLSLRWRLGTPFLAFPTSIRRVTSSEGFGLCAGGLRARGVLWVACCFLSCPARSDQPGGLVRPFPGSVPRQGLGFVAPRFGACSPAVSRVDITRVRCPSSARERCAPRCFGGVTAAPRKAGRSRWFGRPVRRFVTPCCLLAELRSRRLRRHRLRPPAAAQSPGRAK